MQECERISKEIDGILATGGFRIKKWYFSAPESDHRRNIVQPQVDMLDNTGKVLGMT